jgi:curli production assembly/transport component CsgF
VKIIKKIITLHASFLLLAGNALAGDLVYQPQNTAFGGNNAAATQILMSKAQSQDTTEAPAKASATATPQQTDIEKFKANLERRILDQIARQIMSGIFPTDGSGLDQTGTFNTENYSITVNNDNPDAVTVTITDFATGGETTIDIPKF